jgi:hypothetical protein
MSLNPKKKVKAKPRKLKISRLPSWFREIVLFIYELSLFRIGAIVISIIILVAIGGFFTKDGLILMLCLSSFLILFYLSKRFERDD